MDILREKFIFVTLFDHINSLKSILRLSLKKIKIWIRNNVPSDNVLQSKLVKNNEKINNTW